VGRAASPVPGAEIERNNENRKNKNANNIIAKQTVHQQSNPVHLPGSDNPARIVGRGLQQLGHQRGTNAERF